MRYQGREEGRTILSNIMTLKSFIRGIGARVWAHRWFLDCYNRGPRSCRNLPATTWEAVTGGKNTLAPDLQLPLYCQTRYVSLDWPCWLHHRWLLKQRWVQEGTGDQNGANGAPSCIKAENMDCAEASWESYVVSPGNYLLPGERARERGWLSLSKVRSQPSKCATMDSRTEWAGPEGHGVQARNRDLWSLLPLGPRDFYLGMCKLLVGYFIF